MVITFLVWSHLCYDISKFFKPIYLTNAAFLYPQKHQKISGCLMLSSGIVMEYWTEVG